MTRDHLFKSIKDRGGLKKHLNDPEQIVKHRGLGYKTWRIARQAKLNTTALAKLFNVAFETAKDWKRIDDEEHAAAKAEHEAEVEALRSD